MVGSNTVVGHGPTVGQPKFPEATGHKAGVRVGWHPMLVGHCSICALGGQIGAKARSARSAKARKGRTVLRRPRRLAVNGRPRRTQLNYPRRADKPVGQASRCSGHKAGDLVGHTKGAMVGQVCGIKLGHTVAGIVIGPGHTGGRLGGGGAASEPKPCASPNGQSKVGARTEWRQRRTVKPRRTSVDKARALHHGRHRSVA